LALAPDVMRAGALADCCQFVRLFLRAMPLAGLSSEVEAAEPLHWRAAPFL